MIVFVPFVGIARLGALFVQVRVRPLNKIELDLGNEEIWKVDAQDKSIQDMQKMQKYHYDATFGPDSRACSEMAVQGALSVPTTSCRDTSCRDGCIRCVHENYAAVMATHRALSITRTYTMAWAAKSRRTSSRAETAPCLPMARPPLVPAPWPTVRPSHPLKLTPVE